MRILLILIFLCSTANAALTPNKLPRTKTGGSAPTLQDSQILDDGTNVGIGTTAPVKRLDIKSSGTNDGIQVLSSTNSAIIQLIEQSTTAGRFLLGSSTTQSDCISSGDCNWKNSGNFIYSPSSTERFRVTSTGNVGIGTVDPISMLQVFKATNPAILSLTSNPASTTIINLGDTTQPTMGQVAYANASDSMYFVVNGAERMRVSSSGNIGVGTTTPLGGLVVMNGNVGIGTNSLIRGKLHIYDSLHSWYQNLAMWGYKYSNESIDRINISSTGSDPRYSYIGFASGNVSLTQSGVVFAKRNSAGAVGVASIQTSDGSSLVERIVIDGAGNVGIATFSPTSLFEITSTVSRNLFRVNDNGDGDTSPFIINQDGNVGIGTTSASNGKLLVYGGNVGIGTVGQNPTALLVVSSQAAQDLFEVNDDGDGDTSPFVIDSTGNVGIGTSVPTAKLVVGNNGHILSQASSSPTLSSCGTSPSITTGSTDSVGEITVGTGTITSCTLTFVTAFDRAPHCFIQGNTTSNKTYAVTNTTTTMVISSGSAFDTEVIDYLCIGN